MIEVARKPDIIGTLVRLTVRSDIKPQVSGYKLEVRLVYVV